MRQEDKQSVSDMAGERLVRELKSEVDRGQDDVKALHAVDDADSQQKAVDLVRLSGKSPEAVDNEK